MIELDWKKNDYIGAGAVPVNKDEKAHWFRVSSDGFEFELVYSVQKIDFPEVQTSP